MASSRRISLQGYSERWFPAPEKVLSHPQQVAWSQSTARYCIAAAGRRSWKTERAKRKLIIGTHCKPGALTLTNGNFGFFAPTRQQAKKIAWDDLKKMTLPFWDGKPSETELTIYLKSGSTMQVVGMDAPERVEGQLWHGVVMDEYANMRETVWSNHVQPVTSDTGAWVDFIGVPEGRNHFYKLSEQAKADDSGLWGFFSWKSADVLEDSVIRAAKASMDERSFSQEYEAQFLKGGGTVYASFSAENILHGVSFSPTAATYLSFDFNATEKPFSVVVIQEIDEKYVITKEFSQQYTQTETMCEMIIEFLRSVSFDGQLLVCGDYSGTAIRSTATRSDYAIIMQTIGAVYNIRKKIKRVRALRDRINSTNAMFRAADGTRRLFVSDACRKTIEDLQTVEYKKNGVELDDSNPFRTHLSDCVSYYVYNFHSLSRGVISIR